MCVATMGVAAVVMGIWWTPTWGGVGVVAAAVFATLVAQVIPDFVWVPVLLRRRAEALTRDST
jgi:hypothetical protein